MQFFQSFITALYFIFACVLLFLAYSIVRDNIASRLNKISGMLLSFAALGPIFLAFKAIVSPTVTASPFEESLIYNLYIIWELFFPALLLFSLIYPVDRLTGMKKPKLRYIIFIPQIFHVILAIAFRNPEKILGLLELETAEGFISMLMQPVMSILKWIVLGFTLILSSETTLFAIINLLYVGLAVYFLLRGRQRLLNKQNR